MNSIIYPEFFAFFRSLRIYKSVTAVILTAFLIVSCTGTSTTTVSEQQPAAPAIADTGIIQTDMEAFTEEIPGTGQAFDMLPIPGGTFLMGNHHPVEVEPFWMSSHEVTWNLYNLFVEENLENLRRDLWRVLYDVDIEWDADAIASPTLTEEVLELLREADIPSDVISKPSPAYGDLSGGMGTDGFPAINMTQYAAHMFTRWLTVKTGNFYRLPTEAEWEFACRAGQTETYSPPNNVETYAWHRENSDRSYNLVATKEPNAFGLYDMLGNVTEYTLDQYFEDYFDRLEGEPASNPWFKPDALYPRSVRGGSWMETAEAASCLHRRGSSPNWKRNDPQLPKSMWWHTNAYFVGFRIIMPKKQPDSVTEMESWWIDPIQDYF